MNGGIYSEDRCPVCGSAFRHIENRGLFCPNHKNITPGRYRVFFHWKGSTVTRRFREYRTAYKFLTGLRARVDEGDFDPRDFRKDQPLLFQNLVDRYLVVKEKQLRPGSFRNVKRFLLLASEQWGGRNIKTITSGEIEDFLFSLDVSDKTRANARSVLHSFWMWLLKRNDLRPDQMPNFPSIRFELGYRPVIPKQLQSSILDELKRISWHINPKIWLGCRWLCVYVAMRPDDLRRLREEDVNTSDGWIRILRPTKRRKPKYIPLLDEDMMLVEEIRRQVPALPHVPFFRHIKGHGGAKPGSAFGPKYLYKWWIRACESLGIEKIELYGSTRHSSVQALGQFFSPEEIRIHATVHDTNKAFERYFVRQLSQARKIYKKSDQLLGNLIGFPGRAPGKEMVKKSEDD